MGKTVKRCVKSCRKYRSKNHRKTRGKIHRKTRGKVHRKTRGKKNIYKINRTRHQRGGDGDRVRWSPQPHRMTYYLSLDKFITKIDTMERNEISDKLNNWDKIIDNRFFRLANDPNDDEFLREFLFRFNRQTARTDNGEHCLDYVDSYCSRFKKPPEAEPEKCDIPYYAYCNNIHHERKEYDSKHGANTVWARPKNELKEICKMLLHFKLYTLEKILIPSEHDVHARFFVELDMELLTTSSPPTYTRLVINIYKMSQYYNNQRPEIQNKLSNTFYRRFYWLLEIMKNINNTNYINIYQTIPWITFKAVSEALIALAAAPVADASEGQARLQKLREDGEKHLKHSAALRAALDGLERSKKKPKRSRPKRSRPKRSRTKRSRPKHKKNRRVHMIVPY